MQGSWRHSLNSSQGTPNIGPATLVLHMCGGRLISTSLAVTLLAPDTPVLLGLDASINSTRPPGRKVWPGIALAAQRECPIFHLYDTLRTKIAHTWRCDSLEMVKFADSAREMPANRSQRPRRAAFFRSLRSTPPLTYRSHRPNRVRSAPHGCALHAGARPAFCGICTSRDRSSCCFHVCTGLWARPLSS